MTQFLNKSFSVYSGTGETYRDNWDAIFKKKEQSYYDPTVPRQAKRPEPTEEPEPSDDCGGCEVCDRVFRASRQAP